jgi:chemotaxis protein methyltransferase CheR
MLDPFDRDIELSEEEFRLLRDFIHETFGLHFEESARPLLKSRLAGRLASLDLATFEDYYHYLRFGPQRAQELERMISHLTNNETYFFREAAQLRVLAEHVLRSIKERKSREDDRCLRVLSAGCSTGEEAYTLAMILLDSGQFFWNWELSVIGLDIDPLALEKARRAVYFHNSFRSLDPGLFERHFVPDGNGRRVKDSIRRLVTFRRGNVVDALAYDGLAPLDVILCRNVLIYFSDASILRAARLFYERLAPGGFLLLGHAESLTRITDIFTPIRFQGALVYQKPQGVTP